MANDRILFKCRGCGETVTLAKYYPTLGHGIWFPETISAYVEKHIECSLNFGKDDLGGDRCFDLFTESDKRYSELSKPALINKPIPLWQRIVGVFD